jgi:Kef-type K+ transport system membrane component KefB
LLFLAGLEVDLKVITPSRLRAPLAGYAASLLLGSAAGFAFHAAGWVRSPLFLAITLSSSSLGLVVPVLADALQSRTLLGQLIIAGATLGELGQSRCCRCSSRQPGQGPPAMPSRSGSSASPPPRWG